MDGMECRGDNMKGDLEAQQTLPFFNSTGFGKRKEYLFID